MLCSMTAYGRHSVSTPAGEFNWELRSVNNRYLETTVRLPEDVRVLEPAIRKAVAGRLNRGKVDVGLRRQGAQLVQNTPLSVNQTVLESVLDALEKVGQTVPNASAPSQLELLQWPGVLAPAELDTKAVHKALLAGFDDALTDFMAMREREGQATGLLLSTRVKEIQTRLETLRTHRPEVVQRQRERLNAKLAELDTPADTHRLEQELIYVAQRLDIDEELDRLTQHLAEVESVLQRKDPVGRRLDFLMQELNREANTLGSKSSDVDTTGASVDIKVLIEQMREQVQNLE